MKSLSTLLHQAAPKRLVRFTALAALLAASSHSAQAQLDMNRYRWTTGTAASLATSRTGAAIDMSTGTTQLFGPGATNVPGSTFQPIGFDLWFYGQRFSQFSATTTGLVSLAEENLVVAATLTGGLERFAAFHRAFAAADVATIGPSSTGKIHYKTTGTAPNRVLVVEYLNLGVLANSGTVDATYQMRFYETSNVIEYVYGSMSIGSTGANKGFQVGITHKVDATTTPPTYNTIYVATSIPEARYNVAAFSGVNAQAAGPILALTSSTATQRRSFTFDPTPTAAAPLAAPANLTATAAGTSLNVSFTDGADEIAYEVYYSTSGASFGLNPTATANTPDYGRVQVLSPAAGTTTVTANIPGLRANTTYYIKAFALREALSAASTATATTVLSTRSAALTAAMQVHPNPSAGSFTLDIQDRTVQTWQVQDLQGRVVAQGTAQPGRQQLALPQLAAGVYLLQVKAPAGVGVRKIMIQ
ncbi:T9SS type A sorting domain-containing protein [Hymenobacter psychrotolerans]|uniref:Por secretion system C-terminal sorting domain-containing protein n=1 Tax=Hymenobacter psychrotolerans DSM 18569 TaxID=1121959 RepID=A0A1M7EQH9_9BACT|nr:T9SS type A sorting domain-containing protein [Hymenobacter psychrotolerans]SHL94095.1 Por secretion system C-terminal sorting domain-containing protein [Hymenobacter psychrotolerans DSM 18569]